MTSDRSYPDLLGDSFGPFLDSFRCVAVLGGGRCQLYLRHADQHAHAWLEPITGHTHRSRAYPWRPHTIRWTDAGEQWEDREDRRLRWCCMFRA